MLEVEVFSGFFQKLGKVEVNKDAYMVIFSDMICFAKSANFENTFCYEKPEMSNLINIRYFELGFEETAYNCMKVLKFTSLHVIGIFVKKQEYSERNSKTRVQSDKINLKKLIDDFQAESPKSVENRIN
ncbi:hypothetical protein RF11_14520 [Thelohanellus kitauei]|uniref:Uncharacterized protein n=1 Tax=Thelohanellus kitauei TaxID=669202 RepID=A0A0C2MSQ4_THEKT|nr:hypothetical protein RF11_14520 [Thelohanellus kitauei]